MNKRIIVSTMVAAATFLSSASVVAAQATTRGPGRLMEFGIDAGVSLGLNKPRVTTIGIPAQMARVGFYINNKVSLEPALGLTSTSSHGNHYTSYTGELGLLWHFRSPSEGLGIYTRPFAGFTGVNATGSSNDTRALAGIGFGIKLPVSSRIASRFEANYAHQFSANGSGSANDIGLLAGLSFFTR